MSRPHERSGAQAHERLGAQAHERLGAQPHEHPGAQAQQRPGAQPQGVHGVALADRVLVTEGGILRRRPLVWLGLALLLVLALSLFVGRYPAPFWMSPATLWQDQMAHNLVFTLRLPRIVTACLLGMTLAACGTVLQMIFRNPLVEPGLLGVSQGAAFGAALSIIILGASAPLMQGMATAFACLGLVASILLARRVRYGGWILRLILSGIAVSALFSAGVGLLKYLADPLTELPELVFWMLGGLWGVIWADLFYILPPVTVGLVVLMLMRWRLNLLSLDDDTGFSLGASPGRERVLVLGAAVTATSAVVAVAGVVGWIGLLIPHVARRLAGADARRALPASILLGGIFAVICDDLARTLLAGEIPLGILASFFGAVLFMAMMLSKNIRVQR